MGTRLRQLGMVYSNLLKQKLVKRTIVLLIAISINPAVAKLKKNTEKDTAKDTAALVKSLIPSLGQTASVKTSGCNFQKQAWTNSLLTQKSFQEKIDFNENCDIEGSYQVSPHKYFPLNYKIRHHEKFDTLNSTFKYGVVFDDKPTLQIEMKNAKLSGKSLVKFSFFYEIYVNPIEKNPLEKHKGGKLFIDQVDGKKIGKTYPVKFN